MSCQQLYIEQKIQIILYAAKYMHVGFNYHNVSFERGGHPPKNDRLWEGGMRKKRTEGGGGGGGAW